MSTPNHILVEQLTRRMQRVETILTALGGAFAAVGATPLPEVIQEAPWRSTAEMERLMEVVCDEWSITREMLVGRSRIRRVVAARQTYLYLAHQLGLASDADLARSVGRNSTMTQFSVGVVVNEMATNGAFGQRVLRCGRRFEQANQEAAA